MNTQRELADRIAIKLLDELKAGKLKKVGIDQIRAACAREKEQDQERLVKLTTRCIVERV